MSDLPITVPVCPECGAWEPDWDAARSADMRAALAAKDAELRDRALEIDLLKAEVNIQKTEKEALREALKPFADYAPVLRSDPDHWGIIGDDNRSPRVADFKKAEAAMTAGQRNPMVECARCGASVQFGDCCECGQPTDH